MEPEPRPLFNNLKNRDRNKNRLICIFINRTGSGTKKMKVPLPAMSLQYFNVYTLSK